ncbi:MAG: hypothetical protein SA339_11920 [Methanomassiliicoccus sp.]|nr:hypothetical protein [Methanomassiliicoccus sp.]
MGGGLVIEPISHVLDHIGDSQQAEYIQHYLMNRNMDVKTILVEDNYIDKDYLIDFQRYYSRGFEPPKLTTKRVHFFGKELTCEKLKELIFNPSATEEINRNYLGFVVVKPILKPSANKYDEARKNNALLGRTVLRMYPRDGGDHSREYIACPQKVNLYGHELAINALPLQSQDIAVGACASAALWCALQKLFHLFEIQKGSLYEITQGSEDGALLSTRVFPSQGMTKDQICRFFRKNGLEVEQYNVGNYFGKPDYAMMIVTILKFFIPAGIPIIASLRLKKDGDPEAQYHAVVISGISDNSDGTFKEIYVHDDQVGPYASVLSVDGFNTWKYKEDEWSKKEGMKKFNSITLDALIVPLYHKIRLPFKAIWNHYKKIRDELPYAKVHLSFYEVGKFRKKLLDITISNKEEIITMPMPRFVWVIDITYMDETKETSVLDATAPYVREIVSYTPN